MLIGLVVLVLVIAGCRKGILDHSSDAERTILNHTREIVIVDFGKPITSGDVFGKVYNDSILKIDSRVLDALKNDSEAYVTVQFHPGTTEDYVAQAQQILSPLSPLDFNASSISGTDAEFTGTLTESGLEKFKENNLVVRIILTGKPPVAAPPQPEINKTPFEQCKDDYAWYFKSDPAKTFVVNFPRPTSKSDVEFYLGTELNVNYTFRTEFSMLYRYQIFPKNETGLTLLCNIKGSHFKPTISLDRGGGSG